jgi:nicotinate-nucleotide adenylyltransferase
VTVRQQSGLAILGGSFDPPHLTHRRIAETALIQLPVQSVAVIPAGEQPHKRGLHPTPGGDRVAMCKILFHGLPRVRVDDREVQRSGPSFTVDTLAELARELPGTPLYFLIGADNLSLLPTWKDHHRILQLCTVATFPRLGHAITPSLLQGLDLTVREREKLLAHVLAMEPDTVSASALRARLRQGERHLPELLPEVEAYAVRHGLYLR